MLPKIKTQDGLELAKLALCIEELAEREITMKQQAKWLAQCIDLGYTTMTLSDCAGDYRSESVLGQALQERPSLRDKMQIIVSYGLKTVSRKRPNVRVRHYDTSMMHLVSSIDYSLNELNTEYLDMVLLNHPDPLMNMPELSEVIHQLREEGKVKSFGVANFLPRQLELFNNIDIKLAVNQMEFSIAALEPLNNGVLEKCQTMNILPLASSPLASGRFSKPAGERYYRISTALNTVKKECGAKSKSAVAIAWLLRHPAKVIPLLGCKQMNYMKQAAAAFDLNISREQWFLILAASVGQDVA